MLNHGIDEKETSFTFAAIADISLKTDFQKCITLCKISIGIGCLLEPAFRKNHEGTGPETAGEPRSSLPRSPYNFLSTEDESSVGSFRLCKNPEGLYCRRSLRTTAQ